MTTTFEGSQTLAPRRSSRGFRRRGALESCTIARSTLQVTISPGVTTDLPAARATSFCARACATVTGARTSALASSGYPFSWTALGARRAMAAAGAHARARGMYGVVADPDARHVVAAAAELHTVLITVGPVEAAQQLNPPPSMVVDDAGDGKERRADLHIEQRRDAGLGELRAHRLLCAGDLDAGFLQQLQHGLCREDPATELRHGERYVRRQVGHRAASMAPYAHRPLHHLARCDAQSFGDVGRRRHIGEREHAHRGLQSHRHEILEQAE